MTERVRPLPKQKRPTAKLRGAENHAPRLAERDKRVHFEPERIKSDLLLNLTFFEKDAAIPTHLSVPSFQ